MAVRESLRAYDSAVDDDHRARCAEPDVVFREILGELAWRRLHPEVRARFSQRPAAGHEMRYTGVMYAVELSFMGWLFAQVCRLIGTPLAPRRGANVPMDIRLRRDTELGGVTWTRIYRFPGEGDLEVRSTKSRSGRQELTEHIGCGFSMRLRLSERDGDLVFISQSYDLTIFGASFRIPHWMTPGTATVTHEQLRGDLFRFTLSVDHPVFGRTIYQDGYFE